ncbi:hypothetical protein CKY47_24130 [Saccharothrix yanglingensis]|uniref:Glycosyltransferase RgtA/B/C/D-like domain-containing protein n=1 Tax=Saccharothrix yanglingensis TaxID=659496 RepID=A0ABU0X4T2_9PSEU|nr:hypothetical protein [Saccharothrix yanglingensis]
MLGATALLSFARWNMSTALVLAKTLNLASIGLFYAYFMLPLLAVYGAAWYSVSESALRRPLRHAVPVLLGALALVFATQPLGRTLPYLVPLVVPVFRLFARRSRWMLVAIRRCVAGFVIIAFLFVTAVGRVSWLPLEMVTTDQGEVRTGWVLESGDHDLTFMDERDDHAQIIRQNVIVSRTLCEGKGPNDRGHYPALVLLLDPERRSGLPAC